MGKSLSAPRGEKSAGGKLKFLKRDWQLYSLLILPVIYYIIFKYGPMVGNVIAFRKYVPGGPWLGTRWVGIKYFKMFITDPAVSGKISATQSS